ncbi:hypothetical protein [Burkholderia sp. Ac-20379]|uniref:hypothetical protein n=1 Tax=Burkholderia sp. Ac-20379 TaxID=2703900 RepID=UPI00197DE49D|nr:hypothetical protein [Burkholderia sp. Ac-20379]MBN3723135.1 hypothetical protein [Burkholderia sp. Ac-20379]
MLLKQLSDEDTQVFLCVAELLSLADKPILWDGKQRNEIAAKDIGSAKITLKRSEQQIKAMKELMAATSATDDVASGTFWSLLAMGLLPCSQIEGRLIKRLESLSIDSIDDEIVRVGIVREILSLELRGKKAVSPFVPKLMLFELMLFVIGDGGISGIQWNLLDEFSHHYQIENYIVQDLLERAEVTHQEAQKTLAIILE